MQRIAQVGTKRNRMARKPGLRCVVFKLRHPRARCVCIAGSFNGWNPTATIMARAGRRQWVRALFLPPGHYDFTLVVDGQFVSAPATVKSVRRRQGCRAKSNGLSSEGFELNRRITEYGRGNKNDSRGG